MIALAGDVPDGLTEEFAALWKAVSRAGGAVRFRPDTDPAEILAASVELMAQVASGRSELLVARDGEDLAGTVFLRRRVGVVVGPVIPVRATTPWS